MPLRERAPLGEGCLCLGVRRRAGLPPLGSAGTVAFSGSWPSGAGTGSGQLPASRLSVSGPAVSRLPAFFPLADAGGFFIFAGFAGAGSPLAAGPVGRSSGRRGDMSHEGRKKPTALRLSGACRGWWRVQERDALCRPFPLPDPLLKSGPSGGGARGSADAGDEVSVRGMGKLLRPYSARLKSPALNLFSLVGYLRPTVAC